ncbi:MAG: putative peptide zinc metalloprotease protein [Pirellulaceae bacterium]
MSQVTTQPPEVDANSSPRLPFRLREDLVAVHQEGFRTKRWAVKDPVRFQFYHFDENEWSLLQLLNGERTVREIVELHERRTGIEVAPHQIMRFVTQVFSEGLLISRGANQAAFALHRGQIRRRSEWLSSIFGILSIRLPGIDPHRILRSLTLVGRVMFHPLFAVFALATAVSATALVVSQFREFYSDFPTVSALLSGQNLIWLMLSLAIVKILHELGHGLACQHFGGHCHEMGMILLVFTPCLYCDVSDAWMIPSKWKRVMITAAGIYVEMMLATLAVFVWWFSEPGLIHSVATNIVIVCSVNTILMNGNPLLRYDGYYILADLLDVPNLSAQAREALTYPLRRFVFTDTPVSKLDRSVFLLSLYGASATVYRVFVLSAIMWTIYQFAKSQDLVVVAQFLIALVLSGMVFGWLIQLKRTVVVLMNSRVRWTRLAVVVAGVGGLLLAAFTVPLPRWFKAPTSVQFQGVHSVYAPVAGRIVEAVAVGERVEVGDTVAVVKNAELEIQLLKLRARRQEQELRIENLRSRAIGDDLAIQQLESAEVVLRDLLRQVDQLEDVLSESTIQAPLNGIVMARRKRGKITADGARLPVWSGEPLDETNRGCRVERGELLCIVGETTEVEAVVIVPEEIMPLIQLNSNARLRMALDPSLSLDGVVVRIEDEPLKVLPAEFVVQGAIPYERDEYGRPKPIGAHYRLTVRLNDQPTFKRHGNLAVTKLILPPETLANRIGEYLQRTFRFRL